MINDFQILSKLGEGAYSAVYKVKRLNDGKIYALKRVKLLNLNEKEKDNALNEIRILASIRHPNVILYKEAFWEQKSRSLCIIMEYADDGDVFQKICFHKKKGIYVDENDIWRVLIGMLKGLHHLHVKSIYHRDLKSANVFLCKDGTVKIADMNVSKIAKKGLLYTQTGTPYYASPEVWMDKPYDSKSDIWSCGCVIYELATLKPPFRAPDMDGLYQKVIKGKYNKLPSHYSVDLFNVVKMMLQVKPQNRPTCLKLLNLNSVKMRITQQLKEQDSLIEDGNELLNTIKVPLNLHYLTDRLPRANYNPLSTRHSSQLDYASESLNKSKGSDEILESSGSGHQRSKSIVANPQEHKKLQRIYGGGGPLPSLSKSRSRNQSQKRYEKPSLHDQLKSKSLARKVVGASKDTKIDKIRRYDRLIKNTKNIRMGSEDIRAKIEMILGKQDVKNKRDYVRVYGIGMNKNQRQRRERKVRNRLQKLRQQRYEKPRPRYGRLPQI